MAKAYKEYTCYKDSLYVVEYVSVTEYLEKLEHIMKLIEKVSKASLTYLAAAVSDFYIPEADMAIHKIQSRDL